MNQLKRYQIKGESRVMQVNIVLPVLNEEERIENGLRILTDYLQENDYIDYVITIVDNGSTDRTQELAENFCSNHENAYYYKIAEKGVGIAFKEAVRKNTSDIIGYMDIDMSTDIEALGTTYKLFKESDVDIVNASRYSKESVLQGRSKLRNLISYVWVFILKGIMHMKSSDSICGFKFFRKDVIERLFDESSKNENGWFLIIEVLLRAEKAGYNIYELPVVWVYNEKTKVNIFKVTINYLKGIIRLKRQLKRDA